MKNNNGWMPALKIYPIWIRLAKQELRNKYRRATLGPFWITLTMGATIACMSYIFGPLMNVPQALYIPSLALGWVLWSLISSTVTESTDLFTASSGLIKNIRLPYMFYVCKCLSKNLFLFAHNFIIVVLVLIFYPPPGFFSIALSILGFLLLLLNLAITSALIAMCCARFRDLIPLIGAAMQFVFFITPILWVQPKAGIFADFYLLNPAYYAIEIVRSPLMSETSNLNVYIVFLIYTLMLGLVVSWLYKKFENKISLWV